MEMHKHNVNQYGGNQRKRLIWSDIHNGFRGSCTQILNCYVCADFDKDNGLKKV
jgi:hypothetical protein